MLGPGSPLATLRGDRSIGNSHSSYLTGPLSGGGGWGQKEGSLRHIGPYFPTAPEVALEEGGNHQSAPCSGLELGTKDQQKLAPFPPVREHC